MRSIEVRGRTPEEATASGLEQLGLSPEQADVAVLDVGNRGFLGLGAREAIVRITPRLTSGELARRFLVDIVAAAGIGAVVSVEESQGNITASLEGSDLGPLIGRQGHTLEALQYLLHVVISRSGGPRQVTLDIGGYRARREESLRRMARRAADEANRSGLPVSLEPMPPGERRMVHLELQEVSGIRTESQGEEPYRRVVVRPTEPSGGRAPRSPARVAYRPRV